MEPRHWHASVHGTTFAFLSIHDKWQPAAEIYDSVIALLMIVIMADSVDVRPLACFCPQLYEILSSPPGRAARQMGHA